MASNIDKNAKGFLFVLEFALGAPFTKNQEDTILKELKDGWRHLSKEELKVYDEYPIVVKSIMMAKQKDMEKLRSSLEETINEWLDETDQTDPAVKIIKNTLKRRGKVVIKGKPPLTEMSLQAYSEIIAYSKLLQKDSKASPDKITKKSVDSVKKQIRESIKKIEQAKAVPKENKENVTSTKGKTNASLDMTSHTSMMQIQQMTFNNYMWSRGFNYLPATGKMW